MHEIEFYRDAYVWASAGDGELIVTTFPPGSKKKPRLFCSCSPGSYADCDHAAKVIEQSEECRKYFGSSPWQSFLKSPFARILTTLQKNCPVGLKGLRYTESDGTGTVLSQKGETLACFPSRKQESMRFLSRLGLGEEVFPRAGWFDRLDSFVMTEQEKQLRERGHATTRMSTEKSTWMRIAYHLYRELPGTWSVRMRFSSSKTGMVLEWLNGTGVSVLQTKVFPGCEWQIAQYLSALPNGSTDFDLGREEGEILFRTSRSGNDCVAVTPVIAEQTDNPETHYELKPSIVYGDGVYIEKRRTLFPVSAAGRKIIARHWTGPQHFSLHDFSALLERDSGLFSFGNEQDLFSVSTAETFDRLIGMPLRTKIDKLEIRPKRIEERNCEAEVLCRFGESTVNLEEILSAHRNGRRYIPRGDGLIDCAARGVVEATAGFSGRRKKNTDSTFLSISRAELLRLKATSGGKVTVAGTDETSSALNRLFDLTPVAKLRKLKTLRSTLRPYQKVAVQWLLFLWDNYLGGILADEMGLGKTHQAMGLIAAIREQRSRTRPVLVVCPTTVMSHWENLTSRFAPDLKVTLLYGSSRDTTLALRDAEVVVTSYGILRNDVEYLSEQVFDLIVFDEIQVLKNRGSQSSRAAMCLDARSVIGLTGTPIQNTPEDLKTLFDIVLPGYLGGHERFKREFLEPIASGNRQSLETLRKLVQPFILRRLKASVITDLPPKIEDIRTCRLESEQRLMYDEAIRTKGASLLNTLKTAEENIPYIHIFALLGYLKQICNHPILIQKDEFSENEYTSGKWELFKEILLECLESELKVVVYTQYLGMMDLIEGHLKQEAVEYVSLRGASRNRGAIVDRFQSDPTCKVFVGSVRAAGVGIDLTAADVVIHYDRWWNAAMEDQATDRVHRIGQTKSVQIIKLVTRGTVEDRIHRIITAKRQLSEEVLPEDKPEVLKQFSREELAELLREVGD